MNDPVRKRIVAAVMRHDPGCNRATVEDVLAAMERGNVHPELELDFTHRPPRLKRPEPRRRT